MVQKAPKAPAEPSIPAEAQDLVANSSAPSELPDADEAPQPIERPKSRQPSPQINSRLPPIEELRGEWRDARGGDSSRPPPVRLTDAPGLNATERAYLESWQRKVQRIGRLNFPTDEKGNRLRGSLRLLVTIDMDGTLVAARITVSSGDARLDQAAIRIVELCAPFAPVPPAMRRGASVLEVERTWRIGASLIDL